MYVYSLLFCFEYGISSYSHADKISSYPHADKILPRFPAPNKRLSRTALKNSLFLHTHEAEKDAKNTLLKCSVTKIREKNLYNSKWLIVNENVANVKY
jgi:hypothetical protein